MPGSAVLMDAPVLLNAPMLSLAPLTGWVHCRSPFLQLIRTGADEAIIRITRELCPCLPVAAL